MLVQAVYRCMRINRVDPESDEVIEITLLPETDSDIIFRSGTEAPDTTLRLHVSAQVALQFQIDGRYKLDLQPV